MTKDRIALIAFAAAGSALYLVHAAAAEGPAAPRAVAAIAVAAPSGVSTSGAWIAMPDGSVKFCLANYGNTTSASCTVVK